MDYAIVTIKQQLKVSLSRAKKACAHAWGFVLSQLVKIKQADRAQSGAGKGQKLRDGLASICSCLYAYTQHTYKMMNEVGCGFLAQFKRKEAEKTIQAESSPQSANKSTGKKATKKTSW